MFNCNKSWCQRHLSLSVLLFASIIAIPDVDAGVFDACFSPSEYQAISADKLKVRADTRASDMGICYDAAVCLARSEKALSKQQVTYLLAAMKNEPGVRYTREYRQLMGVSLDVNDLSPVLNLDEVTESGFVNFQETFENQNMIHTGYIQVTSDGETFFYHANGHTGDTFLMRGDAEMPVQAGRTNRYLLTPDKLGKFNLWLESRRLRIHYTPVSEVSANITAGMRLAL